MELATYLVALQSIPRVGTWTAVRLARAFPSPDQLFSATEVELVERLDRRAAAAFLAFSSRDWPGLVSRAEEQVARHADHGIFIVAIDDEGYPPLMRLAPRPAALLYVRGSRVPLASPKAVAVIGTREPTPGGRIVAHRIGYAMAEAGFTVVSGLARGIDTAGHEGALDAGGRTVAIMGSAIDKVYPAANRALAARIEAEGGAVVSEYPAGFPTTGRHFVERDRLQAAMSAGVIAVQTATEGGTLHTVRFAREANRLVLVPRPLPGEAEHPAYGGIQALITAGQADVIDAAVDYPDVISRLDVHRDWLLSDTPSTPLTTQVGDDNNLMLGF